MNQTATHTPGPKLSQAAAASMRDMKDGPVMWSVTHGWPSIMGELLSAGMVRKLPPTELDGWRHPTTEITELGCEARAAIAKAEGR